MAAAMQDHRLHAADPVGEFLCHAGRSNRVLIAGDDQRRAVDEPVIRLFGVRQAPRMSGRTPRHPAAYGSRAQTPLRSGSPSQLRSRALGRSIGRRRRPFLLGAPSRRGRESLARRIVRLEDRTEQRQTRDPLRVSRSEVLGNQSSEGMADEVSAIDAEMRGRSFNGLNQKVDGDRLLRRQRPAGSGRSGRTSESRQAQATSLESYWTCRQDRAAGRAVDLPRPKSIIMPATWIEVIRAVPRLCSPARRCRQSRPARRRHP